ncbi:hypothetical protein ACM7N0_11960 [Pseudomonas aeruginosa]
MSSTQHQLIEQCVTRLRGIVETLDNIHDTNPHRWSTDLDEVHSSAESLLAMIEGQAPPSEDQLIAAGLSYPLAKEDAVKLWYAGFRSEVVTVLEAWEAIGHDIGMNPSKGELLDSLRNMAAICNAHGNDMPAQSAIAQRQVIADAITGALASGAQGSPAPEPEHWLRPFYDIGRAEGQRTQELAMLVRMLASSLKRHAPESNLVARATNYLAAKGLAGTPLRDAPASVEQAGGDERAAFEAWEAWQARAALAHPSPAGDMSAAQELAGVKAILNDMADALKRLTFHARTTGGTAGPDAALMNACERAERVLSLGGMGAAFMRGCDEHESHPSPTQARSTWARLQAAADRADTLEHRMMGMMTRHFAEAWRNRDTQKALDGYLSAGIAQLEQERDAALANVDALAVQVLKLGGTISFAHHRTDQAGQVPQAWLDVQAERLRQVEDEGWTPEHDDEHSHGQMARAAACYALAGSSAPNDGTAALLVSLAWPWDEQWWKPTSARRDLIKACALTLAEIERLDRATAGGDA